MNLDGWRPWCLDDGRSVQMPAAFEPVLREDGSLSLFQDGNEVARKAPTSPYFDATIEMRAPLEPPPVESVPLRLFGDQELEWRRHWARTLRAETDKAVMGEFGLNLGRWGSYQEWFYGLAADMDYVRSWYDRKIENLIANVALYAQAVGRDIDVFWLMEDFGTQQGMLISPQVFKDVIAPHYKRLFGWIHENTPWKVFFHSCGGIYPILKDLVDCGVDIINPVQISAAGMDPARLKSEFGDHLTFWGAGVESQSVLPFGSEGQIRAQVSERIQVFAPGGGFVFAPIHNVQRDVPARNIVAAYEAAREFGQYPI